MPPISTIISTHRPDLGPYEDLYKHYHAHPELSFQEKETAASIVTHLSQLNAYEIHAGIGGHGVAAVFKNGEGKTVLLRADIDGLPVEERTGLEYASRKRMVDADGVEKGVMHACGHDMHITSLLAAAETLVRARDEWSGTLILIFQPAEERAAGAMAMIKDGLYTKVPEPDLCIGAHVMPYRSGVIGTKHGLMASAADSFHLTITGRQAHASTPNKSIDPIILASSTILRLQTIVSREVDPSDFAVVTVSAIHAGDAENIIPEKAEVKLNVRSAVPATRERILSSIRRIIEAEATASNAPELPVLKETTSFPFLFNDAVVTTALESSFSSHFEVSKTEYSADIMRLAGSEDFGILATSIGKPSCFFLYGGIEGEYWDRMEKEGRLDEVPGNHSPFFAPVVQPTLSRGVDGYVIGALTFLGKGT